MAAIGAEREYDGKALQPFFLDTLWLLCINSPVEDKDAADFLRAGFAGLDTDGTSFKAGNNNHILISCSDNQGFFFFPEDMNLSVQYGSLDTELKDAKPGDPCHFFFCCFRGVGKI